MKYLPIILMILMLTTALSAEQTVINSSAADQASVTLVRTVGDNTTISFDINGFSKELAVQKDNVNYYNLFLKHYANMLDKGYPELPKLTGSIVIPSDAKMSVNVVNSQYVDYKMDIVPSKGVFARNIDPQTVPYEWSNVYQSNAFYPAQRAELSEPFIMRDYRGITITAYPFAYNPVTRTLRVYTHMEISVERIGTDFENVLTRNSSSFSAEFAPIYENFFLNFKNNERYTQVGEQGRLLVICPANFMDAMTPYVNWKKQKGIRTDLVSLATVGATNTAIKNYIQAQYNLNDGLTFVQLVGDAAQMPTLTSGGGGSDPSYALVAGNDNYPDIFIGRFSAETVAQVQTQVTRSIYYEKNLNVNDTWLGKGMGIASAQGQGSGHNGEADYTHMDLIRTDLLNYGYLPVDQIYDTNGGTATMVTTNLNQGRGIINYCGHGSETEFVTTGFNNNNVNALTNDNKLPFIASVACVEGNFTATTCFAEAWLRSVNESTGAPAGAIVAYMSSINQDWQPPMTAQDEIDDLIVSEQKTTIGALCYNGSCKMIEQHGVSGVNMYKTWHVFGDASIQFRSKTPQPLTVTANPLLFIGQTTYQVNAGVNNALVCLSDTTTYTIIASGYTGIDGNVTLNFDAITTPTNIALTVTAFNAVTHLGTVQVVPNEVPYVVIDAFNPATTPVYNSDVNMNVGFTNIGSQDAMGVIAHISTTDEYVTIIDSTENIGNVTANANVNINNAFSFHVAANAPDGHEVCFTVRLNSESDVWEYTKNIVLCAPVITCETAVISDATGNNNGTVEAGEVITVTVPIKNVGHAISPSVTSVLIPTTEFATVAEPTVVIGALDTLATQQVVYNVTISSTIGASGLVILANRIECVGFGSLNNVYVPIGTVQESFENNELVFPWTGTWTITTAQHNTGTSCYKSPATANSASSSAILSISTAMAGNVTFYSKVSSESGYDFLKFYIDNTELGSWSGTSVSTWTLQSYPLPSGAHTLKWTYLKDGSSTAGSDCAWIDDVTLPVMGDDTPRAILAVIKDTLDFGSVIQGNTVTKELMISNAGTEALTGTLIVPEGYTVTLGGVPTRNEMTRIAYDIPTGMTQKILVNFNPTQQGNYNGVLAITSNDTYNGTVNIPLLANGYIVANDDPIAQATMLKGNYPNPFNPTTTINFDIKAKTNVMLEIYNVKGQKVKTLVNKVMDNGLYHIVWKGDSDNKQAVSSGVYFYRLSTSSYSKTMKMLMIK